MWGAFVSLVLSSSGAGDIPDIQKFIADGVQLGHVLDLEPDGEGTAAAGKILARQFLDPDPGCAFMINLQLTLYSMVMS